MGALPALDDEIVLRLRAERPEARSDDLATELTAKLGKPVNAAWVRQNLHRARDYAGFLDEPLNKRARRLTGSRWSRGHPVKQPQCGRGARPFSGGVR